MVDDQTKEFTYLILRHKYCNLMGYGNLTEKELLEKNHEIFPEMWELAYNLDRKIELISKAIKQEKNLIEISEKNNMLKK